MSYFKYKVTYYSDYDGDEHPDEGIVHANSYSEAAKYIAEDYSEDAICDLYLHDMVIDGNSVNKEELDYQFKTN